jgi:parvulin-like peptidyl-prolyl isomerase
MGRTVLPFTQELYREEDSWKTFRRALRKEDRELLDELFAAARYHTSACTCSGRAVPFEAILMSILVEERRAARELSRRIGELEQKLAKEQGECPGGG